MSEIEPVIEARTRDPRAQDGRIDKFAERRAELGAAALTTLATLGYARTSLREIAQNSEFSHGVLHYYFRDKVDLIVCSVRQYKARCVTRYDQSAIEASTFEELLAGFQEALGKTLVEEAPLHRLWYDLRSQALFEPVFREDVTAIDTSLENMVWRVVSRLADLAGQAVEVDSNVAYALFDGLFQRALLRHLSGDDGAVATMRAEVVQAIGLLFPGKVQSPGRSPVAAPSRAATAPAETVDAVPLTAGPAAS